MTHFHSAPALENHWSADITNDPFDDFNLCIEISCENYIWGVIKRPADNSIILTVYENERNVHVPAKWLGQLLLDAETELPVRC